MENKICEIHNEPALFCEQDAQQNNVLLCRFCIQQRFKIQNIDDVDNKQKQSLQQLELKYDHSIKQLQDFDGKLEQYVNQIQQKLKKFKHQVEQNISYLIEKKNQIKSKSKDFTTLQLNQINEEEKIINNQFTQIKQQLSNQLKELEINNKLYQLDQLINNLQIDVNNKENEQIQNQKMTLFNQKFNYQLLKQSSYKQNELCSAIAFNKDATTMIAGCEKLIKVFKFKDDKLREVEQLSSHQDTVSCLQFMKQSNEFISAGYDSTIIIWEQNYNNQWQSKQFLKSHSLFISCITINQNEDQLISGSHDETIKFWSKQNNIWSCNQSINCLSSVFSISLNDQENKLIASIYIKQIFIIQLCEKEWTIKQKISVEQPGIRLSFIKQDEFVLQLYNKQHLLILDYDAKDKMFKQGQQLQYSNKAADNYCFFPIRYISSIGLIMVKNDHYVHLIKRQQNGQFTVEQSINFGTNNLYGGINDDGRYLATWNFESKEIQIRKFEY